MPTGIPPLGTRTPNRRALMLPAESKAAGSWSRGRKAGSRSLQRSVSTPSAKHGSSSPRTSREPGTPLSAPMASVPPGRSSGRQAATGFGRPVMSSQRGSWFSMRPWCRRWGVSQTGLSRRFSPCCGIPPTGSRSSWMATGWNGSAAISRA